MNKRFKQYVLIVVGVFFLVIVSFRIVGTQKQQITPVVAVSGSGRNGYNIFDVHFLGQNLRLVKFDDKAVSINSFVFVVNGEHLTCGFVLTVFFGLLGACFFVFCHKERVRTLCDQP